MSTVIDIDNHPFFDEDNEDILLTPAIDAFADKIMQWLEIIGFRGGMVWGYQLYGKTTAIDYVVAEIKSKFGVNFPVFIVEEMEHSKKSDSAFYGHLLLHVGHTLHDSGNATKKHTRLLEFLSDAAAQANVKKVIFFIDEAQVLEVHMLSLLKALMNNLKKLYNLKLVVLLVGQPELKTDKTSLEQQKNMQLVGRFMAREFEFFGLRNAGDVAYVLQSLDSPELEYPAGSGCSYTKYFFPGAFELGWRFEKEGQKLWDGFQMLRDERMLPILKQIPMDFFIKTIRHLIKKHSTTDLAFLGFDREQIESAIVSSGYVEGSIYYTLPQLPKDG